MQISESDSPMGPIWRQNIVRCASASAQASLLISSSESSAAEMLSSSSSKRSAYVWAVTVMDACAAVPEYDAPSTEPKRDCQNTGRRLRDGHEGPLRAVRRARRHLEPGALVAAFDRLDPAALRRPASAAELFVDRPRQPARTDPGSGSGSVATHAGMWLSTGLGLLLSCKALIINKFDLWSENLVVSRVISQEFLRLTSRIRCQLTATHRSPWSFPA
jgi:hypothetical protein